MDTKILSNLQIWLEGFLPARDMQEAESWNFPSGSTGGCKVWRMPPVGLGTSCECSFPILLFYIGLREEAQEKMVGKKSKEKLTF